MCNMLHIKGFIVFHQMCVLLPLLFDVYTMCAVVLLVDKTHTMADSNSMMLHQMCVLLPLLFDVYTMYAVVLLVDKTNAMADFNSMMFKVHYGILGPLMLISRINNIKINNMINVFHKVTVYLCLNTTYCH